MRFIAYLLLVVPMLIAQTAPLVDFHQHLYSPAGAKRIGWKNATSAAQLVKLLDEAGIQRAIVLSTAYQYANPNKPALDDEYELVKAENDYTSQQVSQFPKRLIGYCGVNPLKDYALAEIDRCARDPFLKSGLKLHFGNSDVQLDRPDHLEKVRNVFRRVNGHRMAITVHMHPSVTMKRPYTAAIARIFLEQVITAAPDIPIQIAHLGGAGGYSPDDPDPAVAVFVEAIAKHDKRMKHVYFDANVITGTGDVRAEAELIVRRIRQIGVKRIRYGSDAFGETGTTPLYRWTEFKKLPLTPKEFTTIIRNVP